MHYRKPRGGKYEERCIAMMSIVGRTAKGLGTARECEFKKSPLCMGCNSRTSELPANNGSYPHSMCAYESAHG